MTAGFSHPNGRDALPTEKEHVSHRRTNFSENSQTAHHGRSDLSRMSAGSTHELLVEAYNKLRNVLPVHPNSKKLSKLQVLTKACRYIQLLTELNEYMQSNSMVNSQACVRTQTGNRTNYK